MNKKDYYKVLELEHSATSTDIRKEYRKLALKFHPERNSSDSASECFSLVTEAFHVLSDANRRAVYDQYGFEGLKNGVPAREGYDGFPGKYSFHGDSKAVFREFFGGDNPYADHIEHPTSLFGSKFGGLHGMSKSANAEGPKQEPPKHHPLPVTLADLYLGSVKKLKLTRNQLDENGMTTRQEETTLTVNVGRGWKAGTQLVFPREGDQGPNIVPADIVFVLEEVRDLNFERIYVTTVPLVQALTCSVITITTLDERILRIPVNDIIHPTYTKEIPEEGMPLAADPTKKGKLIIKFKITFPSFLSEGKKKAIRHAFDKE